MIVLPRVNFKYFRRHPFQNMGFITPFVPQARHHFVHVWRACANAGILYLIHYANAGILNTRDNEFARSC